MRRKRSSSSAWFFGFSDAAPWSAWHSFPPCECECRPTSAGSIVLFAESPPPWCASHGLPPCECP
eukprot:31434-Pelagococcus_subviridis.AAC.8